VQAYRANTRSRSVLHHRCWCTIVARMYDWILAQSGLHLYIGLFLMLMGGAIGLPIPEDLPLIAGGILIQLGKTTPETVFIVCYSGIIIGDVLIYSFGRWLGPSVFRRKPFQTPRARYRIKRIRLGMERRSVLMIFVARHLFYLRTLTFLSCGALRMRFSTFLAADAIAALVSAPLMLALGYFASEHFDTAVGWLHQAKIYSVFIGIGIAIGAYILYRRSRALEPAEEEETSEESIVAKPRHRI
jgi:membrane protein DedA with SNARE-associated domain